MAKGYRSLDIGRVVERLEDMLHDGNYIIVGDLPDKVRALIRDLKASKIRLNHSYTIGIDKDGYLRAEEITDG